MPLLKREIDVSPEDFFELPLDEFPWWVLHVRGRQEKVVARHLATSGVPFYLPQMEQKTRRSGRTFTSFIPLFGGYLFGRGSRAEHPALWRHEAIVRVLPVDDPELLRSELLQVFQLQRSGAVLLPVPDLVAGDVVRVTEGAFAGYQGVVQREKSSVRLVVAVTMLQRAVAVEFPREMLVRSGSKTRLPTDD
jgi:hypothetical protein